MQPHPSIDTGPVGEAAELPAPRENVAPSGNDPTYVNLPATHARATCGESKLRPIWSLIPPALFTRLRLHVRAHALSQRDFIAAAIREKLNREQEVG